ncbi:hypothetical protein GOP47_0018538 [Adiantum capillus-veneris]|uniref:14-3-3 domain-containing protein n=1 Tax=Adiantum capillus-veneris TaxID=13818 RepID=A0A9D4UDD0_ADICA|nr:hypothetical protein GOP47_0018538 [Adiantum capillus-veneris]
MRSLFISVIRAANSPIGCPSTLPPHGQHGKAGTSLLLVVCQGASKMEKNSVVFKAGNREQSTAMARVALAAHRHEDMLKFMKRAVQIADTEGDDPTEEERSLLWEAYKSVVNALRVARNEIIVEEERKRAVTSVDSDSDRDYVHVSSTEATKGDDDDVEDLSDKHGGGGGPANDSHIEDEDAALPGGGQGEKSILELLELYRKVMEDEICHICKDFVKLLEEQVHAQDEESKAYFLQIRADHLRYICEVQTEKDRKVTAEKVRPIYLEAQELVKKFLPARHPTRLGLALNFAVFYFDILNSKEEALRLSREAVQDVVEEAKTTDNVRVLGLFDESRSNESEQLFSMLKNNITLWSTDDDKDNKGDNTSNIWRAPSEDSRG